jgi:hypothetical protein
MASVPFEKNVRRSSASRIKIEFRRSFDYFFFANLGDYAKNPAVCLPEIDSFEARRRNLGRIIDTLVGGSMAKCDDGW